MGMLGVLAGAALMILAVVLAMRPRSWDIAEDAALASDRIRGGQFLPDTWMLKDELDHVTSSYGAGVLDRETFVECVGELRIALMERLAQLSQGSPAEKDRNREEIEEAPRQIERCQALLEWPSAAP